MVSEEEVVAPLDYDADPRDPQTLQIYTEAAAFYVVCLKAGYIDEAQEFAEWFLETFDIDLED